MTMQSLFSELPHVTVKPERLDIPGLAVIENYVDVDFAEYVAEVVDRELDTPWSNELRRRVQHYGYRYDYRARRISSEMRLGQLPDWAISLAHKMVYDEIFSRQPDQVIVNEYQPGQGIAAHVDAEDCFGDVVASLSLLSACTMSLRPRENPHRHVDVDLPPRSLLVLSGTARHAWLHSIAARSTDKIGDVVRPRSRRLSATFRTVIT